jgi:recombination protein RecT
MADQAVTIREYIGAPAVQKKMAEMFTDKRLLDNFVQSVISIAGSDELLAVAEPRSVFNACLTAASLNLPINKNLGFAHIIGYRNNRKNITEAQFQLGARGFKELAQRTGQYQVINQGDIREGELKGRNRLTGELEFNWQDDDAVRQQLPIIGYFSYFRLKNGFASTLYMSMDEIVAHGKRYSQSFKKGFGPWVDNFDAMALKTVSKLNISKNGPLSIELQRAVEADQAVIGDDDRPDYIDGSDLASVNASDEQKKAIVAANKPTDDAPLPIAEQLPIREKITADSLEPELSVAEKAKRWEKAGKAANAKAKKDQAK